MASRDPTSSESTDAALDTNLLKEIARKALVDSLNSVNGVKTLVLDPSLAGPLGLVTEVALLKHHGVDKMFWLEAGPLTSTTSNIIYLCRPLIKHVKVIAEQIKRHAKDAAKHTYTLLLVPRASTLVTRILEEEGVLGDVSILSYSLQFIPIEEDVVSLEYESVFKDIWVDGDETAIYDSAQALITLQKLYGLFPRVIGKGDKAARLAALLTSSLAQARTSSAPDTLFQSSDKIDALIVLDRRVDMITPLLTQLTYEGLIDELIGIKNSHVELPTSLPAPTTSSGTLRKENKKKYHLSSSDALFGELRDLNFSAVGRRLNKVARRLEDDYKASRQAKTIPQLRDVVGKLGGLQSEHQALRLHTGVSELLVPITRTDHFNKSLEIQQDLLASYKVPEQISAIEELIAQNAEIELTLENIKREILQTYGYHNLPLLLSLASPPLAILLPNPLPVSAPAMTLPKFPYTSLRKSLRLLIDDNPEALDEVENDISFVYSGYAPISIRLVQCVAQRGGVLSNPADRDKAARQGDSNAAPEGKVQAHAINGWKGFEDVLATIPGETVDIIQQGVGRNPISPSLGRSMDNTTTTVVFFLGGCTYTEIAALRWVGRQNQGRKFLIATTGIVSASSIIDGIAGIRKTGGSSSKNAGI
ncbi:Sec1-like protein [Desarmillaria tabescens]|uniref:Sec1-like protein n=1 Tax=Armillaria tabescens TaxID=1929756 RepID=A0AA39NH28_ARMTA|nr:Sec1-like protein [Desarmillaria tabescens]KAK0465485.1 Sec1-like protein [Desarmillaria tabescens]